MRTILRAILALVVAGSTITCTRADRVITFRFDVIDQGESPCPAMIVVNDDWTAAAERKQYVNVVEADDLLQISIAFTESEECEVTAAPVLVEQGRVTRVPKSRKEARDYSGFMAETRRIRIDDPTRQLFVLVRRSN